MAAGSRRGRGSSSFRPSWRPQAPTLPIPPPHGACTGLPTLPGAPEAGLGCDPPVVAVPDALPLGTQHRGSLRRAWGKRAEIACLPNTWDQLKVRASVPSLISQSASVPLSRRDSKVSSLRFTLSTLPLTQLAQGPPSPPRGKAAPLKC